MNILFLDTSTEYAITGVCLADGAVVTTQIYQHRRELSTRLYPAIERALADASLDRSEIDALSVGLGPGSFTGVRVAVTTMRTLAQVMNKPLYAFGTLEAMAETARLGVVERSEAPILALLPSRRDEVYAGLFDDAGQTDSNLKAISYRSAKDWLEGLGPSGIGVAPLALANELELNSIANERMVTVEHPSEQAIAYLTARAFSSGDTKDPLSLDPLYIAPPQVSQHKQK